MVSFSGVRGNRRWKGLRARPQGLLASAVPAGRGGENEGTELTSGLPLTVYLSSLDVGNLGWAMAVSFSFPEFFVACTVNVVL